MNISILLRHSGIWVSEVKYERYKSDGIVVGQSISFLNLKAAISVELDIDVSRKSIEISYIIEGNSSPMKIKNDMGVNLYLEVKKSEPEFAMYPLCIDTYKKIGGDVHNFDGTCGEITCVEDTTQDTEALVVVESRICDSYYIPELEVTNYIIDSNSIEVVPSSEFIFSVYEAGRRYIVCLERKVCSCGRFQLDEIPCAHAIAVLKEKNVKDMHPYCSDYYKPDALAKTYEIPMVPMPDKEDWSAPDDVVAETVYPPRYRRLAGRPRKRRKKNADEKITVNTNCCGQCGQEGHNRRTCTFFPKEK
ncbi:hypothetical protein H5410_003473 [Solanum commersonii]|uniref:SWIM-type domain-containing protein n=1 Tax=Solanum commersonii TaxID=4109 RepID=A0A9J6B586_SOLCO|nr:hypothetical protein H5410_003473 [Solanum commersonii]